MADLGSLLGAAGIGGNIGKAIVQLELDSKKYLAEMEAAKGQTVAGTNAMGSGFAKFGGLAQTALLGSAAAVVAFGAVAVKAAIEANEAHLKLANTFQNNAMLSDSSVAAFERQADALRDLTGVDDEAIVGAQALIGQFNLTGQQVQKLIPLIVDLSTKMGIDLEAAAKAVGKSTQGTTGGLARYGIQVDKAAASTDAYGATLDALGKVQGFAAAQAKEEPWKVLGAQFEELSESVGKLLLPFIQDLATGLQALIPILEDVGSAIGSAFDPETYTSIPIIGEVFKAAGAGIEAVREAINTTSDSAKYMQHDLSDMQAQAAMAEAGFYNLSGGIEGVAVKTTEARVEIHRFADMTKKELEDWKSSAIDAFTDTSSSLEDVGNQFTLTANEAVAGMRKMANQARQSAEDLKKLTDLPGKDEFKAWLIEQGPAAVHAFVEGTKKQRGDFIAAWKSYEGATQSSVNRIKAIANSGGTAVGQALAQGVAAGVAAYAPSIYNTVDQVINNAIAHARAAAQAKSPSKKMFLLGLDLMTGLQDGITDGEQKLMDQTQKVIDKTIAHFQRLLDETTKMLDKFKSKAADLASTVSGAISSFGDITGGFTQQILGANGETTEGAPDAASIKAFMAQQVQAAQEFADVLKKLQKAGASAGLLQQIASAGPSALPFAQALLGTPGLTASVSQQLGFIQGLAGETAKGLSEKYFGDKIDELKEEMKTNKEILRVLEKPQRLLVDFRGGSDAALRQYILSVLRDSQLSRASV